MNTTQIDDGGPAFPNKDELGNMIFGMTLRDWFAGQARSEDIEEYLSVAMHGHPGGESRLFTREQAKYRYADAMVAARKEQS